MKPRPSRRAVAAVAALLLSGFAVSLAPPSTAAPSLGPGCDHPQATVTHAAGGKRVRATGPVPVGCATETGYYTGETTIAATKDGSVYFSAANWEWALARTKDDGATWEDYTVPGPQAFPGCGGGTSAGHTCDDSQQAKNNTVADAFVYVDPYTDRVFWAKTFGYALCASLNFSDDGKRWTANTRFGCPGGDYEKVAAGPPPAGGTEPSGYPNIVYGCTNGPAPTFVVGPGRVCYRSYDGGKSFDTGGVPVVPSPLAPRCLHFQEAQTVGPDGTVYLPLGCTALGPNPAGADAYVALSTDEATTWSYVPVPTGDTGVQAGTIGGGVSIAVDPAGTLYVLWLGTNNHSFLAVTKDKGKTWTGPFDVTMPGVTVSKPVPQIAAGKPGQVAVGYYGYTDDESRLNGYLTESFNADKAKPVFHSAQLNAPKDPLYFPVKSGSLPRNDYLGVTIAPNGTPWVALVKLLSDAPDAEGFIQSTGFAGRLVLPRGGRGR